MGSDIIFVIFVDTCIPCCLDFCLSDMPPKTKKHKKSSLNLVDTLTGRLFMTMKWSVEQGDECETMNKLLDLSHEAENTDDEEIDPSFELNSSVKSHTTHQTETFCEELCFKSVFAMPPFRTIGKSVAGLRSDRNYPTIHQHLAYQYFL